MEFSNRSTNIHKTIQKYCPSLHVLSTSICMKTIRTVQDKCRSLEVKGFSKSQYLPRRCWNVPSECALPDVCLIVVVR
ncbi:hypothetical protein XENTR_v10017149 [Xenopus tropicalis]|nr:hypothetical protein XENTR_v10017149 [Xenopus tropicalis]